MKDGARTSLRGQRRAPPRHAGTCSVPAAALGLGLAAMALSMTALGCDYSCLDIACQDEVMISFSPAISRAGRYRFELVVDGEARSCELDFDPARSVRLPEECRGLWISGSDVPAPRGGVSEGPPYRIRSWSSPPVERVQITVLRDGTRLNGASFAPEYRKVHRYDSCGKCTFAGETLALP